MIPALVGLPALLGAGGGAAAAGGAGAVGAAGAAGAGTAATGATGAAAGGGGLLKKMFAKEAMKKFAGQMGQAMTPSEEHEDSRKEKFAKYQEAQQAQLDEAVKARPMTMSDKDALVQSIQRRLAAKISGGY